VRDRLVRAPPLRAQHDLEQPDQSHPERERQRRRQENVGLEVRQIVQALHRGGVTRVGRRHHPGLHDVKSGIDLGCIDRVGAGGVAGVDRGEHMIDGAQVVIVHRQHVGDQQAVGGLADGANARERRRQRGGSLAVRVAHLRARLQPVLSLERFLGRHGEAGLREGVAQLAELLDHAPCPVGRERAPNGKNRKHDHHACEAERRQMRDHRPVDTSRAARRRHCVDYRSAHC
jgi:hypothetical protein